jgi:hypothetical protein
MKPSEQHRHGARVLSNISSGTPHKFVDGLENYEGAEGVTPGARVILERELWSDPIRARRVLVTNEIRNRGKPELAIKGNP